MLLICHRCKNHINSNKDHSPPKAYWNTLDPGPIPRELQELTQAEIRLLARIKPFIKIIKFDGVLGQYGYGTAERRMLLLILSWAATVHKMQGSTVDYAVIYVGRNLFAAGQPYVALSRVKSLDGLLIEELDCSKLAGKVPCNNEALQEMDRMRNYRPPSAP
ncbi:hypothetical protein AVEN_139907-1 [Araneus ventricosus]|uniref:DUF6570 domain-containing protein n=1 Tax=Araneus ventricosus TaxID=182803 RepID=A0A4Y2JEX6_ARAVE|nr:hypothetical protein AVEN_139907-1 [Araneus ventricosus]